MNTKVFYGISIIITAFVLFCISYTILDITNQINNYQYSLDLLDEETIKLKSNKDNDIYVTTPDSLFYYIDKDNN